MIPNNNISVLPFYANLSEQNARKWWIYDKVYPLFTQQGFVLPFQIQRNAIPQVLEDTPQTGYVPTQIVGENVDWSAAHTPDWDKCQYARYEAVEGETFGRIKYRDLPAAAEGGISICAAQAVLTDEVVLGVFSFAEGLNSGEIDLPEGTTILYVTIRNTNVSPERGYLLSGEGINTVIRSVELYNAKEELIADVTTAFQESCLFYAQENGEYDSIVFAGLFPILQDIEIGQYYLKFRDIENTWYSEIFTIVGDIAPYLKIEWWDNEDFVMDAGTIFYRNSFKNIVYLRADLAKPEYVFEEEGQTRDGYFFPVKQLSEKRYKFSFWASEFLLDVMRFIRMSDHIRITYAGKQYNADSFLITPEWEANGDIAAVRAEFDTQTVAKKLGRGISIPAGGDFNNDYNNDYNNQ